MQDRETGKRVMRKVPGMLLLGSAGRNSGKTELACALLRRLSPCRRIVGIKATAIREGDNSCPRGGRGCGVCTSLEGAFAITEETSTRSGKDTSRLLAAGADRVFWLRAKTSSLAEGLAALLDTIGPDAVSVCESNSLRTVVQPGLFLMVRDRDSENWKATAQRVRALADRTVLSDGRSFDLDLSALRVRGGRWVLREDAAAIVLAGGESRRMERDKTTLAVAGRPLIAHACDQVRDHFEEVLVSAADPLKYAFLGVPIVPDRTPGLGPMMGLATALEASHHDLNLAVACDIPDVDVGLAHRMLEQAGGYDVVVPRTGDGFIEPLFAVYRKSTAAALFRLMQDGERKVRTLFPRCRTCYFDLPDGATWSNLNTREEYLAYVGANGGAARAG